MKNLLNINCLLVVIIMLLSISLSLGESYATYILQDTPSEEPIIKHDCLKLIMDENDITLSTTYPVQEELVSNLIPYSFSIKNVCDYEDSYIVNIEELTNSTLDLKYVRAKLDNNESYILNEIPINENVLLPNSKSSRTIASGKLSSNESHTYYLRLYLDENSISNEVENLNLATKIVVTSSLSK